MATGDDQFILAPLRGVTGRVFRNVLAACFPPPDEAIAPFIPTVAGTRVNPALLKDVDPALEQRIPVVPQVIGKSPEQLRVMLRALRAMGYRRVDLNAGCPWPFVVKKGRGTGLLADAETLETMLAAGCEEMPGGFSIKVRLGIKTDGLLAERMALLNRFPLREVTIHPRSAKQMYTGTVDEARFAEALALCRHPVVYNGDIRTCADWKRLKERFPQVTRWMIGRGLAANPAVMASIRAGEDLPFPRSRIRGLLERYLALTEEELCGRGSVLGRMKELWSYLAVSFADGERLWTSVKLCRTVDEYRRVLELIKGE